MIDIKHEELKCSCCGYIPNDEDINKTGYHLVKCNTCGQFICDLCSFIITEDLIQCAKCDHWEPIGQYRKEILAEEYTEGDFNIDEN